jgi:hypothetical protein
MVNVKEYDSTNIVTINEEVKYNGEFYKCGPSPSWQTQPWFIGQGSTFVRFLTEWYFQGGFVERRQNFIKWRGDNDHGKEEHYYGNGSDQLDDQGNCGSNICYKPFEEFFPDVPLRHSGKIYLIDDKSKFHAYRWRMSVYENVLDEVFCTYKDEDGIQITSERSQTYPKGVGIFLDEKVPIEHLERMKVDTSQCVVLFHLTEPSSISEVMKLKNENSFLNDDLNEYFQRLRQVFLPIVTKNCRQEIKNLAVP